MTESNGNGGKTWQTVGAAVTVMAFVLALIGIVVQQASRITVIETKLQEVETQFCGADNLRNLMHAADLRVTAMIWERVFPGSHYPTDNAYYPIVCNRAQ